jgi:hypothetical protein
VNSITRRCDNPSTATVKSDGRLAIARRTGDKDEQDRQQPLGVLDPARVKKTLDIVSGAYTLKYPVAAEDLFAPGFVN